MSSADTADKVASVATVTRADAKWLLQQGVKKGNDLEVDITSADGSSAAEKFTAFLAQRDLDVVSLQAAGLMIATENLRANKETPASFTATLDLKALEELAGMSLDAAKAQAPVRYRSTSATALSA